MRGIIKPMLLGGSKRAAHGHRERRNGRLVWAIIAVAAIAQAEACSAHGYNDAFDEAASLAGSDAFGGSGATIAMGGSYLATGGVGSAVGGVSAVGGQHHSGGGGRTSSNGDAGASSSQGGTGGRKGHAGSTGTGGRRHAGAAGASD